LKQLQWGDVRLEAQNPNIIVRAETAKNKTEESVYLMPEIVAALKDHRLAHWSPLDLVFPNGIPRASRLQVNLEWVGVAYKDAEGRYGDFHALRYTYATFMRKNGVSDNFARKQMRHESIQQTDGYTDEAHFPIAEAMKALPPMIGYAQIGAQILGASGQNGAQPDAKTSNLKSDKKPVNTGGCQGLAQPGAEMKMEPAKGFEAPPGSQLISIKTSVNTHNSMSNPLP
jgi:hypothetical protein